MVLTQFSKDSTVVISASGGADSQYLLWVMAQYFLPDNLHVIYCNHGLRSATDIENDYLVIQSLCKRLNISHVQSVSLPVQRTSTQTKQSIETTARQLRRQAFVDYANQVGAIYIAMGHHLDDHIETALFQLIRGTQSQLNGIRSISNIGTHMIIRPLLHLRKSEILDRLSELNITYHYDITNDELGITRNKIRHQLLPIIESINPNYREKMIQFITYHRDSQAYIQSQLESFLADLDITHHHLILPTEIFNQIDGLFLQQNWIRYAIKRWVNDLPISPLSHLDAIHIVAISDLFSKSVSKQCSVPAPFFVQKVRIGVRLSLQNYP